MQAAIGSQDPCAAQPILGLPACFEYILRNLALMRKNGRKQSATLKDIETFLSQALAEVRAIQNAALPVMRLPTEILVEIFRMAKEPEYRTSDENVFGARWYPSVSDKSWVQLTSVCRYWRDTMVSCPSLWATITIDTERAHLGEDLALASVSLLRSQRSYNLNAELFLHGESKASGLITQTLSQVARMRELYLFGSLEERDLDLLRTTPAPHLQTVVLQANTNTGARLPPLFAGDCMSVRYLALSRFSVYPECAWRNLRQLHLSLQHYDSVESIASLLGLLRSNAALEDLMFSDVTYSNSTSVEDHAASQHLSVALPNLQRLAFERVRYLDVGFILSHLNLSPGLSLSISTDELRPCQELAHLRLRNALHLEDLSQLKKARIVFDASHRCTLYGLGAHSALLVKDCAVDTTGSLALFFKSLSVLLRSAEELWVEGTTPRAATDPFNVHGERLLRNLVSGATGLKRLVVNLKGGFVFRWDDAFEDEYSPYLQLDSLEICGTQCAQHPARCPLRHRRPVGDDRLPVVKVYVQDKFNGSSFDSTIIDHNSSHKEQLIQYVEVKQYPKMTLPPICTTQSEGRWNWPLWKI